MTERIAGTRIERATDDDRSRTILVSDLHVPSDGGAVFESLQALLTDAAATPGTRVVVLGDLFDAYTGPKQARVGIWRDTAKAFDACVQAGVSLTLLHGNRDFMLDEGFGRLAGCRIVAGGLRIRLGDRSCLLLHGDELCQRDLPYQRAKRYLRSPMTRALLRSLPLWCALKLADRARDRSAKVIADGDQTRFDPVASAVAECFVGDVDLLVFGHIHRPARGWFEAAGAHGEYAILPAFDAGGVHLLWYDGSLGYRRVGDAAVVDYPPRDFR